MKAWTGRARISDDGYRVLYRVREVLDAIAAPRLSELDVERAFALAADLERFRDPASARLLDAVNRVLTTRFRDRDRGAARRAYDELNDAIREFTQRTGAVVRSRLRVNTILGAASGLAWTISLALDQMLRLVIVPSNLSASPTPEPQRTILALVANIVVIAILAAAFLRIRHHGWWIAFLVAVIAAGVPQGWHQPIYAAAGSIGEFLAASVGLQVPGIFLRLPFHVLETWAVLMVTVAGLDWWWRRSWRQFRAKETSATASDIR